MNNIKRVLGIVWILLAVSAAYFLIHAAIVNIDLQGKLDINKPMPWIIIITVFIPIAVGMVLFGFYALKGEYDLKQKE